MAALADLIARRFPRDPRLAVLAIPLWGRIKRAARRFERLMARVAAGKLPKPRGASPSPRRGGPHRSADRLPRGIFWLIRALGYEAAGLASQLEALLADPAAIALLAAVPGVGRITRPMKRLLAVGARQPRPVRPTPVAKPKARQPLEFIPPASSSSARTATPGTRLPPRL